jgi:hypothetical protein
MSRRDKMRREAESKAIQAAKRRKKGDDHARSNRGEASGIAQPGEFFDS